MSRLNKMLRVLCALSFLFLLLPLVILGMVLIWIETRDRRLFKQVRVGKNLRPFTIYKLKTMIDRKKTGQNDLFVDKEKYTTKSGRLLRMSKIDEIPQLWNIIKGDMDFVGPRPIREPLHNFYMKNIPNFERRYQTLPGLTGISQIVDPENTDRSLGLSCDCYYINNKSVKLDIQIIVSTIIYLMYSLSREIYNWTTIKWLRRVNMENTSNIQSHNLPHNNPAEILYKKSEKQKENARGYGPEDQ